MRDDSGLMMAALPASVRHAAKEAANSVIEDRLKHWGFAEGELAYMHMHRNSLHYINLALYGSTREKVDASLGEHQKRKQPDLHFMTPDVARHMAVIHSSKPESPERAQAEEAIGAACAMPGKQLELALMEILAFMAANAAVSIISSHDQSPAVKAR